MALLLAFCAPHCLARKGGLESLRKTAQAFASVACKVSPSVVFIEDESSSPVSALGEMPTPFGEDWPFVDDFFRRFFGEDFGGFPRENPAGRQRRPISQGSGFVYATHDRLLADKTYILTNNHVVQNAASICVAFQSGREFEAKITGNDPPLM